MIFHYLCARDFNEAVASAEKGLEIDPNHGPTLFYLRLTYERMGRIDKASEIRQRLGLAPELARALRDAVTASDTRGYWRAVIGQELQRSRQQYISGYRMAQNYASLGDPDHTFEWLQRADRERESWLIYLKVDPAFDNLRADPRFAARLRSVGLP